MALNVRRRGRGHGINSGRTSGRGGPMGCDPLETCFWGLGASSHHSRSSAYLASRAIYRSGENGGTTGRLSLPSTGTTHSDNLVPKVVALTG